MLNFSHCFQKDDPFVNIFALHCMFCTSYHKCALKMFLIFLLNGKLPLGPIHVEKIQRYANIMQIRATLFLAQIQTTVYSCGICSEGFTVNL